MTKQSNRRAFFIPFLSTICVLGIALGMMAVDYNGRKLSFADDTPPLSVSQEADGSKYLQVYGFGIQEEVNVTVLADVWKKICDFCCIPNK